MKIVLLTALGVLLGLFLFLVAAYILIKWKLKKLFGGLGEAFKSYAAGMSSMPQYRLKLTDATDTPLHHPESMAELTNELSGIGFVEAGTYSADEDSPVLIRGMVLEAESIIAAMYDMPDQGPFLDLVRDTESGTHFMATSTPTNSLDKPPWTRSEVCPGAGAAELHDALKRMELDGPLREVSTASFKETFEQAYAREMDWRVDRGGYTDEEVSRMTDAAVATTEEGQDEITDTTLSMIRIALEGTLRSGLEAALHEAFLEQTDLSASEWERVEDRVEIVHKLSDANALTGLLVQLDNSPKIEDEDEAEAEQDNRYEVLKSRVEEELKFHEPIEVFARLAPEQPNYVQLKKLAHLESPSACDIYVMPEIE